MIITKFRQLLAIAFLGASIFFFVEMGFIPRKPQMLRSPKDFELVETFVRLIKNDYLEDRDPARTVEGAFRGMIDSLDPLCAYLDSELIKLYLQNQSSLNETGLIIYKKYGSFPQVAGIIEGSPAASANLKLGDFISAINNSSTLFISMTEANLLLKSSDESPVRLKIIRGNETLEFNVARTNLFPQPLNFEAKSGKPAILKVHRFSPDLISAMEKDVLPLLARSKKPLILDLRNTCEGDYESAARFVNFFLSASSVGYFKKRDDSREIVGCPEKPLFSDLSLVVWINQATLGPAEFVAGVLQEIKKSKVIGMETMGLVARQETLKLDDNSLILLTNRIFYLPSDKTLWGTGLRPDVSLAIEKQSTDVYYEKTIPLLPKLN